MQFLDNSKYLWRVWLAHARASLVREMEFRGNFFSGIFRQILWLGVFVLFIEVIFQNTSSLAGWPKEDVLIVLALSRFLEGIADTFFNRNISRLPEVVQDGMFDFFSTKPINTQLYTSFNRVSYVSLGNLLTGIILLVYAFVLKGHPPTLAAVGLFFILAILGLVAYYSMLLLTATLVFRFEQLQAFVAINSALSEPFTTPFNIFPRGVRIALTYFIPLAFVIFVPAQALTGRLVWWQLPVAIGITAIFLLLANLAWRAGLRRYSSASS